MAKRKLDILRGGPVPDRGRIARLLGRSDFRPMPRAAEREAWSAVAAKPWLADLVAALLERAEKAASAPLAPVRATDYLSFFRTGSRNAHSASAGQHSSALSLLTAAECLEHGGRFLDALLDVSWATAEETSWIMPPHLGIEGEEMLPDAGDPRIDLRVAGVGKQLAEMLYLLGPEMDAASPMWRRRINFEIRRQVVEPYLARTYWWEKADHNWNAVCADGVVASVLLADFDRATRARVLHKALSALPTFLGGFTADGGCSEGPGYWAYGVGTYCSLAYNVHCATGGGVDLLADPLIARVLAYPTAMVLSGSKVANFADCGPEVGFRSGPVVWAAARVGVPGTVALASRRQGRRPYLASMLDLWLTPEPGEFDPPSESFLPDLMVLVARGARADGEQLVLAVKGGHNGEKHNHNDVGTFIVHWRGRSLVCDLGAGDYVKRLFSPERYELLTTRSRGHDVPLVNGVEQGTGEAFRAEQFALDRAGSAIGVSMELASAYPPEAGLKSLRRRVTLHRDGAEFVEMSDEVAFAGASRSYELPLYTEGGFEPAGEDCVIARSDDASLKVSFDPRMLTAAAESVPHGDAALARRFGPELSRCTFRLKGAPERAVVALRFTPLP